MRTIHFIGAVVVAGLATMSARADRVLQFDINSITASTGVSGFGTNFTGTITLSKDADSMLTDLLIDGSAQNIAAGQLSAFAGTITLNNGVVSGGGFSITDTSGNIYAASIVNGVGDVTAAVNPGGFGPGPFTIDGLTFQGTFNSNTFAGVDVSTWNNREPLEGSFLQFKFGPDANGDDTNADVDIFVVVPLPAPAGLAGLGLIGIGALRRRR